MPLSGKIADTPRGREINALQSVPTLIKIGARVRDGQPLNRAYQRSRRPREVTLASHSRTWWRGL